MSVFKIDYKLKAMMIGLKSVAGATQGLPQGTLLYETYTAPQIRAIDPQVNLGKLVKVEGKITNALGMNQGTSSASG